MGSERQEKYKQQYMTLRKSYETQLEQFYSDHPDAKPPRLSRARSVPSSFSLDLVLLYLVNCSTI